MANCFVLVDGLLMKIMFKSLLILFVLFFSSPHAAMAESYPEKVTGKLGNGIANVVTGFIEIPKNMLILSHEETPAYGATVGLMVGIVYMVGRTLFGAIDIATFMIPTKPFVDPNYIWKDFDKTTTYNPDWQMR